MLIANWGRGGAAGIEVGGEGMREAEVFGKGEAQVELEAFDELWVGSDHEDGIEELLEAGHSSVLGVGLDFEFVFESPG